MKLKCLACAAMLVASTLMSAPSVRSVIPDPDITAECSVPIRSPEVKQIVPESVEMPTPDVCPVSEPRCEAEQQEADTAPETPAEPSAPSVWREDVPLSAELQNVLLDACDEHGIDPLLMLGLIWTESRFVVDAVSSTGDYGLCQLNHNYFDPNMTPEENLRTGVCLLGQHLKTYGNISAALTAYHVGHDDGTRSYAGIVINEAARYGYGQ